MSRSDEGASIGSESQRQVRVAWAQDGTDFADMLKLGLGAELVNRLDNAEALPPVAVAVPASRKRPIGRRQRAAAVAADGVPGSDDARTGGLPRSDAAAPVAAGNDPPPAEPPIGGASGADRGGYDVEVLNREYALVNGLNRIFQENRSARLPEQQLRMLSIDAFKVWLRNKKTVVWRGDRNVSITWANRWLEDPERRDYEGVEFFPDADNKPGTPNYLNLWRGFSVTPAPVPDPKRYKTFRDHVFNNIGGGDQALFDWIWGFFAHALQRPRERIGVALVLRGKMGSGKTKVGEVIGSLTPAHWLLVDSPRYVTGQFNAHMASCLWLQADEATWGGNKEVLGRLKGLITSSKQFIEAKGVDPVELENYVRLILTSNEDWVVPAGLDERRFAIFNVSDHCIGNFEYFREMDEELAAGGREHLLADLLSFDLSRVDLRKIPRTDALLEQKIRSLDPIDSWWFDRLMAGTPTRSSDKWLSQIPSATLYGDYIATCEQLGIRRKQPDNIFGARLKILAPSIKTTRPRMTVETGHGALKCARIQCYAMPPLAEARRDFEKVAGQSVRWPEEPPEDDWAASEDDTIDL